MGGEVRVVVAIDPDAVMRRVLARVLTWRDFEPALAGDAERGLALIVERRPRVVIVDDDLLGTSALSLIEDVEREMTAETPWFVLVSAAADRIARADQRRFDALHTKPFRASALLDDIERLFARAERRASGVLAVQRAEERVGGE